MQNPFSHLTRTASRVTHWQSGLSLTVPIHQIKKLACVILNRWNISSYAVDQLILSPSIQPDFQSYWLNMRQDAYLTNSHKPQRTKPMKTHLKTTSSFELVQVAENKFKIKARLKKHHPKTVEVSSIDAKYLQCLSDSSFNASCVFDFGCGAFETR